MWAPSREAMVRWNVRMSPETRGEVPARVVAGGAGCVGCGVRGPVSLTPSRPPPRARPPHGERGTRTDYFGSVSPKAFASAATFLQSIFFGSSIAPNIRSSASPAALSAFWPGAFEKVV
jgi:hypothetical protein